MSELGDLLRKLRGKQSLRDVAKLTGLSHSYISDIEKGYRRDTKTPLSPSPDTLKRLAKAYNYPYEELLKVAGILDEQNNDSVIREESDTYDTLIEKRKYKGVPLTDEEVKSFTDYFDWILRDKIPKWEEKQKKKKKENEE